MREPEGFRAFVAARQNALLRTAWLLTGDWQQAEDLVQTALVKVWPRWERVAALGDPEPYVRRTLVTTYLTWKRRRWTGEQPHADLPDVPEPADGLDAVGLRAALTKALATLPPAHRAVLVLRFYEDLSVEQTADVLGVPPGTVKSQTARALERLAAADVMEGIR